MTLVRPFHIIPQKWSNHVVLLRRYWSAKKLANLARVMVAYRCRQRRLNAFPPFLKVEASNQCRVGCKHCYAEKSGAKFPLDRFADLVRELSPYVFEVSLHDIGEPLLHEQLIDFIRYAHAHRVGTLISTSLSIERPDEYWHELVNSGLDRLVVAIDGITPETYTAYRTQGNLALVLSNLRRILLYRERDKSPLQVTWQMLDLASNRHEQSRARARARELGCDRLMLITEENLARRAYYTSRHVRTRPCIMAYLMFIVTANKKVRPCCNIYRGISDQLHQENEVGDLNANSFREIWNSAEMQILRDGAQISQREYCRYCDEL